MAEGVGEETASTARPTAFISYASQDAAVANAVVGALERAGIKCWIAPRDVVPGALYADEIVRAINRSSLVVLVLSAQSIASPHVSKELERASSKRRRIIALRTDGADLPGAFEYFLSESQWIDAGTGNLDAAAAKLVEAVRSHLGVGPSSSPDGAIATHTPPEVSRNSPRRWTALGFAVLLLMAIAASVAWKLWLAKPLATATPATAASISSRTSIAVMPFANLTGDAGKDYLGDGMAEELINVLTKVPGLKVPARTSSFAYKGRNVDIREIAKDLEVGTVLEGSVRAAGKRIRITAQLINAQDGLHLWSETYDEEFTDIFRLQEKLATQIASALQPNLSVAAQSAIAQPPPTRDVEAYNLYLQGLSLLGRLTSENEKLAIDYFNRALARDPGFARAYAMIAEAHMNWGTLGGKDQANHHRDAERAARQALALDANLANAHTALSGIYQGQRQHLEMASHLRAALTLAPNSGDIRAVAMIDTYGTGRLRYALEEASKGYALAPAGATIVGVLAYAHALVGDDSAASRYAAVARELGLSPRGYPLAAVDMIGAVRARRYAEATAIVDATVDQADSEEVRTAQILRRVFSALADPAQRKAALATTSTPISVPGGVRKIGTCLSGAVSYALLEAMDAAYESIDHCLEQLAPDATYHVAALELSWWMPEFRAFRRDSRFQSFVSRLGLMEYWQEYGPPDDCDLRDGKLICH